MRRGPTRAVELMAVHPPPHPLPPSPPCCRSCLRPTSPCVFVNSYAVSFTLFPNIVTALVLFYGGKLVIAHEVRSSYFCSSLEVFYLLLFPH